jgi:hypothetical protein
VVPVVDQPFHTGEWFVSADGTGRRDADCSAVGEIVPFSTLVNAFGIRPTARIAPHRFVQRHTTGVLAEHARADTATPTEEAR